MLSRRIKALEHELGFVIFERSAHGVSLTGEGERFIINAKDTLQVVNSAFDTLSQKCFLLKGEIWIGIAAPFSDNLLHDLLQEFRIINREVSIHLIEGTKTEILRILSLGEIDLAIVHEKPVGKDSETSRPEINRQCLWSSKICVVLPAEHELAKNPVVDLKSLLSECIFIGSYGCDSTINDYHAALNAIENRRPHIDQQMVSRETLINLVGIGCGITFTNESSSLSD